MWDLTIGTAGLVVSVVGFAFMIAQLVRTANATEATQRAVERTEKRMALNHLLVLLPQFRMLESELDLAATDDDRKSAMKALTSYANVASQTAGLLDGQDGIDSTLVQKLQHASRDASKTKARIVNEPRLAVRIVTKDFRNTAADLAGYVGGLAARFSIEGGR